MSLPPYHISQFKKFWAWAYHRRDAQIPQKHIPLSPNQENWLHQVPPVADSVLVMDCSKKERLFHQETYVRDICSYFDSCELWIKLPQGFDPELIACLHRKLYWVQHEQGDGNNWCFFRIG